MKHADMDDVEYLRALVVRKSAEISEYMRKLVTPVSTAEKQWLMVASAELAALKRRLDRKGVINGNATNDETTGYGGNA